MLLIKFTLFNYNSQSTSRCWAVWGVFFEWTMATRPLALEKAEQTAQHLRNSV